MPLKDILSLDVHDFMQLDALDLALQFIVLESLFWEPALSEVRLQVLNLLL